MKKYNAIFFLEDNLASFKVLRETIGQYSNSNVLVVLMKASYGQNYPRIRDVLTDMEQNDGYNLDVEFFNLNTETSNVYKQVFPGCTDKANFFAVTSAVATTYLSLLVKKHSCNNVIRACTPLDKILGTCLDIPVQSEHIMSHQIAIMESYGRLSTSITASSQKDASLQFEDSFSNCGIESLTLNEVESVYLKMGSLSQHKITALDACMKNYTQMSDRDVQIAKRIQEVGDGRS
ncbi:MAG TPA: hypothetical protein PKI14_01525 [Fervidobacterium sp.]|nr:hypothetical protein [Fervidobacterium sp.]